MNGALQDETALGKLMQDFANAKPSDMNYGFLADRVRFFKENKEGVVIMSEVIEQMWNEAVKETRKENARRMLTNGKLSLEEIAEYSGLSLEEVKQLQKEQTV